jgi:hypothetical protein
MNTKAKLVRLKRQPRTQTPPEGPEREFLSIEVAAQLVAMSAANIRRLLTQGKLTRFKFFSRTLIKRSELLAMVQPVATVDPVAVKRAS